MRFLCLVLAFVLFFPASYAASAEDTLSALSRIEGADMTLYSLYSDYAGIDKDKSMEYAELFLRRIDSASLSPLLAPLYVKVGAWYELDKYRFSKAITYMEKALEIYRSGGDEQYCCICKFDRRHHKDNPAFAGVHRTVQKGKGYILACQTVH